MFAAIRSDIINLALLVHVAGAVALVGGAVTAAAASIAGWRGSERAALRRLSAKTLLAVALPGWFVMRIGAQWVYAEEGLDDLPEGVDDPTWIGIGFITADLGGLLLLIAIILGFLGLRRERAAEGAGGGGGLVKASGVLAAVLVAIYVVAVWAMGAKPT